MGEDVEHYNDNGSMQYKDMEAQKDLKPSIYMSQVDGAESPLDSPSSFSSFSAQRPLNPSSIYSGYTSRFSMSFDQESMPPPPNNGLPNVPPS